jgi:hypothetical protein
MNETHRRVCRAISREWGYLCLALYRWQLRRNPVRWTL